MKKVIVIIILLLLVFLGWLWWHCKGDTACMKAFFSSPPTATPTATFSPTATLKPGAPTPRPPTKTKTPTPTFTPTFTPSHSLTPTYTFTPTFTPTFTRTFTRTFTNTPTHSLTPTNTFTPTFTFTFTPVCTAVFSGAPIKEIEPNENETEATLLGSLTTGEEASAYGVISRVGASGDHDVYRVDVDSPGFYAILDCYTWVPGPPQPGDRDFRLNAYDILFRPLTLPPQAPGPVQVADLRKIAGKTFYLEVVGAGGKPGRYRITAFK